jgi:hypothetical protein
MLKKYPALINVLENIEAISRSGEDREVIKMLRDTCSDLSGRGLKSLRVQRISTPTFPTKIFAQHLGDLDPKRGESRIWSKWPKSGRCCPGLRPKSLLAALSFPTIGHIEDCLKENIAPSARPPLFDASATPKLEDHMTAYDDVPRKSRGLARPGHRRRLDLTLQQAENIAAGIQSGGLGMAGPDSTRERPHELFAKIIKKIPTG